MRTIEQLTELSDRRDTLNQAIRSHEQRLGELRRSGQIDTEAYSDLLEAYREAAAAYTAAVNEAIARHGVANARQEA